MCTPFSAIVFPGAKAQSASPLNPGATTGFVSTGLASLGEPGKWIHDRAFPGTASFRGFRTSQDFKI